MRPFEHAKERQKWWPRSRASIPTQYRPCSLLYSMDKHYKHIFYHPSNLPSNVWQVQENFHHITRLQQNTWNSQSPTWIRIRDNKFIFVGTNSFWLQGKSPYYIQGNDNDAFIAILRWFCFKSKEIGSTQPRTQRRWLKPFIQASASKRVSRSAKNAAIFCAGTSAFIREILMEMYTENCLCTQAKRSLKTSSTSFERILFWLRRIDRESR